MLGTGRGSDFTAHVMGLGAGFALGLAAAQGITRPPQPAAQAGLALGALALIGAAWAAALA